MKVLRIIARLNVGGPARHVALLETHLPALGYDSRLAFSVGKFVVDYVSTAQVDQLAVVSNARGRVLVVTPGSAEQTVLNEEMARLP